ncbi:hypothetical protein [Crocinitomix catalasitica]|uniref:hypothetical protein n=1 Tax=Crocinitomix catalasitica TaxID=184607 RepID=UPI001FDF21AF|nr:hypothetical protein [Crocinitomix catalasitica]
MKIFTTICPTVSLIAGISNLRTLPSYLGISITLTDRGKQLPDTMRFQSLYRYLLRFASNNSILIESTPALPLFERIF